MESLIKSFYTAFTALDGEGMAACYHDEVVFEDPAFGQLKHGRARNMWRMLCESQKGKDFRITFNNITANETHGSTYWEAWYTFSRTGRKVHNQINAEFEFRDGLIIRHADRFDLYRWSRQALGIQGALLGWTSFFRKKLQQQTNHMLDQFEKASAKTN